MLSWFTEISLRRINSMVHHYRWSEWCSLLFPLLFNSPVSKVLLARNTGCPFSAKLSIMPSAALSHSPSGLLTWVPYHSFSDRGTRNDQCPCVNLRTYSVTLRAFAIQFYLFPRFVQSMSLYIDMKMIHPFNCSGSHFDSAFIFRISSRIPNVVNPGKFVHSNSIGSPSIRSKSWR